MLRRIRARSDIPVIIITGEPQDEVDRALGLELGADDYLTKPFNLRELLARARATLRRQEMGRQSTGSVARGGCYRFNGWELRRKTRKLTDPAGEEVALTKSEYALLVAFLEAPGRSVSREHLLQATRTHEDIYDRSIDVQVLRLRRKLEQDPSQPTLILTERGVGYVFAAPVEPLFQSDRLASRHAHPIGSAPKRAGPGSKPISPDMAIATSRSVTMPPALLTKVSIRTAQHSPSSRHFTRTVSDT